MFLFPDPSYASSPPQMRRHRHFVNMKPEEYDVEDMLRELQMVEIEYRRFKQDVALKMKQFEEFFVDHEYALNKILEATTTTKNDGVNK